MSKSKTVVFVCTGNTCRSPMAAAIATSIFKEHELDITVLSVGVAADDGFPASENAIGAMHEENIDLKPHRSTQISEEILSGASLILTMTAGHLRIVKTLHPKSNAFTLGEYANNSNDVSDPYGGSLEIYRQCAAQIKQLLTASVAKIKEALAL